MRVPYHTLCVLRPLSACSMSRRKRTPSLRWSFNYKEFHPIAIFYLVGCWDKTLSGMHSGWVHKVLVSVSSLLTWTGFYTGEFQACQLSRFYHESHNSSASLTISQPHKLISQAVHFAVWISTDAVLMVQVTPISYLQGRMWYDVGKVAKFCLPWKRAACSWD